LRGEADVSVVCSTEDTGNIFEAGAGWYGKLRWERSKGAVFRTDESFTPSAVRKTFCIEVVRDVTDTVDQVQARLKDILNFDNPDHPENITDADLLVCFLHALSSVFGRII
jgi:multifunctional beta-oxidation protein